MILALGPGSSERGMFSAFRLHVKGYHATARIILSERNDDPGARMILAQEAQFTQNYAFVIICEQVKV